MPRLGQKKGKCVWNGRAWVKPLGGRKGFKVCKGLSGTGKGTGKLGHTKGKHCRRFKTVIMRRDGKKFRVRRCADYA